MKKENFHTFFKPFELCIFSLIISSRICSGADYQYENCVQTNCGTGPDISFPFYVPTVQESYCGYPRFEISCKNGVPILQLSENDENEYVVEEIFYQNRTIRVSLEGSDCPQRIRNTTLPAGRFDFVSATTASLHLLSDCRNNVLEELSRYEVRCGSSGERSNGTLAMYDGDGNLGKALENCQENIVAPVEILGGERGDVAEVLRRGFAMSWVASDCSDCRESGGRCGFNETSFHFRCFCPDRPHSRSCEPVAAKCPESIQCGDHFSLHFPFTDTYNPKCGLFAVEGCTNSGNPIFHSQGSPSVYQILGNISTNKFKVLDSSLYLGLSQSPPRCFPFFNISLPKSPSISFSIPSNLTLHLCSNHTFDEHIQGYFENYSSFYHCEFPPPTVYYLPRETDVSAAKQSSSVPANCGVIQLPIDSSKENADQLFDLLTAEFDLEWYVLEACYKCYQDGGQCLLNTINEFRCGKGNMDGFNL